MNALLKQARNRKERRILAARARKVARVIARHRKARRTA